MGASVPSAGFNGQSASGQTSNAQELRLFIQSHQSIPYMKWSMADQEKFAFLMKNVKSGTMDADSEFIAAHIMREISTPPIQSGYRQAFNYDDLSHPFVPEYENDTKYNVTHNPLDIHQSGIIQQLSPVPTRDPVYQFMHTRGSNVYENLTGFNATQQRAQNMAHLPVGRSPYAFSMQGF